MRMCLGYMQILYNLYEGLEDLWILVSEGVTEDSPPWKRRNDCIEKKNNTEIIWYSELSCIS